MADNTGDPPIEEEIQIQNADDGDVNDNVNNNQNVKEDVTKSGKEIVDKLLKANKKLRAFKTTIDAQIETLIRLVKNTKLINTQKESEIKNQLLSIQKKLNEKEQLLSDKTINEEALNKQLESISKEVNLLEKKLTIC